MNDQRSLIFRAYIFYCILNVILKKLKQKWLYLNCHVEFHCKYFEHDDVKKYLPKIKNLYLVRDRRDLKIHIKEAKFFSQIKVILSCFEAIPVFKKNSLQENFLTMKTTISFAIVALSLIAATEAGYGYFYRTDGHQLPVYYQSYNQIDYPYHHGPGYYAHPYFAYQYHHQHISQPEAVDGHQ